MSVLERDVVLTSQDGGRPTIDFPITRLANLEDSAQVKETPAEGDFLPIVDGADGGQMKKTPVSAILGSLGPKTSEITVTLSADGWSNGTQTVSGADFLANGYGYIPAPASQSYEMYSSCAVRADDVETDGEITFRCSDTPTEGLTVNIMRIEVE